MGGAKVTGEMVVHALKVLGRTVGCREIARQLGANDTRAIATAARKPASDGRIRVRYQRGAAGALYRFVRLTPRRAGGGSPPDEGAPHG